MFDGEDALGHIAPMWGCWPSVAAGRVLGAHGAGARVAEQGQPAESGTEYSKSFIRSSTRAAPAPRLATANRIAGAWSSEHRSAREPSPAAPFVLLGTNELPAGARHRLAGLTADQTRSRRTRLFRRLRGQPRRAQKRLPRAWSPARGSIRRQATRTTSMTMPCLP